MKLDFLKSSNFWTAVVLAIGGLFAGFNPEVGTDLVIKIFGLLASAKVLREYFKTKPALEPGKAVNNSNWWNYIATIVTAFIPAIPLPIFDHLQELMVNLINGNWQASLVALFSISTILYNLFQSKKKEPEAQADVNTCHA
jgi:hypothetical protein